ncbi:MAG: serine hydrolase domain-containing protein, partial [Desulfovibrionaceae bacterium]
VWTAGLASVELNAPVTPQTVFCIGSLTKVFTAALVMELVQEDKLGLDDLLGRRLSGITDPKVQAITLRQLLEHASGLADFLSSKTFQKNMAVPYAPRPLLDMALKLPMSFAPGSRFGYSNTNYLVLGLVLEQATGTPYAELLQRRAVTPLGLVDTRLGDDRSIFPGRAQGYRRNGEPGDDAATQELAPPILASLVPPWASGGLISRPGEFVKLARLGHLLRPAALDAMRRDDPAITEGRLGFPLTPDGPYFELDYSPGFEVVRLDHADTPMLCKSGSFPGFASWFVWLPERGLALAASCNNETAIMDLFGLLAGVARDL